MSKNESLGQGEEDFTRYFKCRSCGIEFDSFGDMQKHIMTESISRKELFHNNSAYNNIGSAAL